jgi:release factor glutamine methyltransferase
MLVRLAVDGVPRKSPGPSRLLDLGCGSGCLGISIADARDDLLVDCLDIDPLAVRWTAANARRHAVESRVSVRRADVFDSEWLDEARPPYEGLVSSPPYVPEALCETDLDPLPTGERRGAVVSGDGGWSFYERIAGLIPSILAPGGFMAIEIGYTDGLRIAGLFDGEMEALFIANDLSGTPRVIHGRRRASAAR